jgi:hypothetical protein
LKAEWVAVIIAGVTVVINFFTVFYAGRVQTRIARDQRIGDRRIDTDVELLKWADETEESLKEARGIIDIWETIQLPDQLSLHAHAFASDDVNKRIKEFQDAWLKAKLAIEKNEDAIRKAFAEAVRTKDYSLVRKVVPEYQKARTASSRIHDAVRSELTKGK